MPRGKQKQEIVRVEEQEAVALPELTEQETKDLLSEYREHAESINRILHTLFHRKAWINTPGTNNWSEFVKVKFGFSPAHGYRLVDAGEVELVVGEEMPESCARHLKQLAAEDQIIAWKFAKMFAAGGEVKPQMVKAAVKVVQDINTTGTTDYSGESLNIIAGMSEEMQNHIRTVWEKLTEKVTRLAKIPFKLHDPNVEMEKGLVALSIRVPVEALKELEESYNVGVTEASLILAKRENTRKIDPPKEDN